MADAATRPPVASDTPRAWQAVLEHVESRLLSGELAPGDRLPGERALSAELGVGRSSVREALRVLEVLGLIRTQAGSGPSAGAIIISTPGGGMSALMRLQVAARGFPVADIVRTRLILETSVAGDLAEATPQPDLSGAEALLDAMDAPDLTPAEFLALDAAFHLALAEASGNQVITATMAGLRSGIEGYARAGVATIADWNATSARLRAEHRGILDAITRGGCHDGAHAHPRPHLGLLRRDLHRPDPAAPTLPLPRPLPRGDADRPSRHREGRFASSRDTARERAPTMVQRQLPNVRELAELMRFKTPTLNATDRRLEKALTIADLRAIAKRRTPKAPFDYTEGAAEGELSLARARQAFQDIEFHPSILRNVPVVDTSREVLGGPSALPFGIAPTGFTRLMQTEGEEAGAGAAGAAGIPFTLSTLGTTSIEGVKAANPHGRNWFQLYVMRNREISYELARRAASAGFDTLFFTVDTPVAGARLRDKRNGFSIPPQLTPGTIINAIPRPAWWINFLTTPKLEFASLSSTGGTVGELLDSAMDPTISLEDLDIIREIWPGKIMVKGVQTVEDAKILAGKGVDGVVLSNHGGRQLDRAPIPFHLLPHVVREVGSDMEVHLDTGIMSGADIVASIALGARFTLIGRAYLYGLMAGGRRGVDKTIDDPPHRDRAHDEAARGRHARRARPAARHPARPAHADREAGGGCRGGGGLVEAHDRALAASVLGVDVGGREAGRVEAGLTQLRHEVARGIRRPGTRTYCGTRSAYRAYSSPNWRRSSRSSTTEPPKCSTRTATGTVAATQADPRSTPTPRWMSHHPRYMGWRLKAYGPVVTSDSGCSSWNSPEVRRRRSTSAHTFSAHPAASTAAPAARVSARGPGSGAGRTRSSRRTATTPTADPAGSGRFW